LTIRSQLFNKTLFSLNRMTGVDELAVGSDAMMNYMTICCLLSQHN